KLSSQGTEGQREIRGAKQRLAAAKTQASLAAQMKDAADKEVKSAAKYLKDAKARWGISGGEDSDTESSPESVESGPSTHVVYPRKKRKKGSIPYQMVITGCGLADVNGTYKLDPKGHSSRSREYVKYGSWEGKQAKYRVFRGSVYWYIQADGLGDGIGRKSFI
ncbi:hypothetical protein ACHAWF_003871, partial [Thalassiosira exigua]